MPTPDVTPTTFARDLNALLGDLNELVASGNTLISRTAPKSTAADLGNELDAYARVVRSELFSMGHLVEELETEESRAREVAS